MAIEDQIENIKTGSREDARRYKKWLPQAQVAIYVMVGGGIIGRMFAEQPADAYIDIRVGKRPYKYKEIAAARKILVAMAEKAGLDPHKLPAMPNFGNLGVF